MVLVGDVAWLVVGVLALWIGARSLVTGASRLAGAAGISALVVGLTVVAFGTSAPEIVVSTGAALDGRGAVAVGNVVGSNVFNLGVILGLVAVITPFRVAEPLLRRDVLAMAASTVVGAAVLANLLVSQFEGGVLLALLGCYLVALVIAVKSRGEAGEPAVGSNDRSDDGVPSVVAARRGDTGIAAGNVVGSNVFNVLGVLGLAAAVRPLAVDLAVVPALGWLAALTAVATVVLATGRLLTRIEGGALVAFAAGYWAASTVL